MEDTQNVHREIINDAVNDPEEKPNPLLKIFFVIMSVIVIGTTLLAYLGGGQSISYIQGRLQSETLLGNYYIVLHDGRSIHLPETVYDELVELLTLENKEFKACLIGNKEGNRYLITDLYVPHIYDNSYTQVISDPCSDETIIPLHSHPIEHCVFSEQDIRTYESFKERRPDALLGLMCGLDRFNFYDNP